jgi:hypothetical protein
MSIAIGGLPKVNILYASEFKNLFKSITSVGKPKKEKALISFL